MLRVILSALFGATLAGAVSAQDIRSSVNATDLPEPKRTTLGLYLTPADAAAALEHDPAIVFLDVRDPAEIMFVGHPTPVDAIVPLETVTHDFDAGTGGYRMVPNPNFVANVERVVQRAGLGKDAPIVVMCRSGSRSAEAVNVLASAGYTNVWNLVEGFEGDKNEQGERELNGWRNANLPWTYRISADQAWSATR